MLSVPIYTDKTDSWDLQDTLQAVEDQFYATQVNEDNTPPSYGGRLSPQ